MNYNLIAYAQDFVSFILQNIKNQDKIENIILFGSVVRGEAKKNSDIDLFIEIRDKIDVEKLKENFYNSIKVKKYWNLLGIKNEIHCELGVLDEWKDLERSISAQGVILYGKYRSKKEGEPYYLFSIEQSKNRNKNVSIWRKLYGYKQIANKKLYQKKGLIKEYNGERIAKGVFLIPSKNSQRVISFLKNNKLKHKIILIWKEN